MPSDLCTLHASGAETETGNGSEVGLPDQTHQAVAYLDVTAASGTTPTLDVKLQGKDPLSGKWFDTGDAFAQKTTTGQERLEIASLPDSAIRGVWTIGGTTPSFTFTVSVVVKGD